MHLAILSLFLGGASAGTPPADGIAAAIARGDAPRTTSVLVLRGDAIAYERYFEDATAETLHDTRSATKSVTALAVGAALGRQALPSVEAKAFSFLGDLKPFAQDGPLKRAITIEDLLTMSSALDCDDSDPRSPGNEEGMYPQPVWTRWAADLPVRPDFHRDASGRGPFHYCTAGTVLLGQIVQRAVKQPIDVFIREQLFAPLGIESWEFARSPSGEAMTGGGLRLRTRDLGKLAQLVRAGGRWAGKQLIPAAFVSKALTIQRNAFPGQDYGYLFWHRDFQTPCGVRSGWFMSGNGGSVVAVFADLSAVVVVTRRNYRAKGMHDQTRKLLEESILPALACG